MSKISKHRNIRRPLGQIALCRIKKMVQIDYRKHNNDRNIASILNIETFINALPNNENIDHEIHINENYYDRSNPEESDVSFNVNEEQPFVDENEINAIFDPLINEGIDNCFIDYDILSE